MKRCIGLAFTLLSLTTLACSAETSTKRRPPAADDSSSSDETDVDPVPATIGVPGARIRQIAIYQGVKRTLVVDGVAAPASVPIVAGRDAVVRVFYETDGTYDRAPVVGRLSIDGFAPIETQVVLGTSSTDAEMASTVNFVVPGDHVTEAFAYSVALLREGFAADDNPAARHPATASEAVVVEGKANTFRVKIAPLRYDADGSGRLPDLSPAALERFRTRILQLFPVSDVELTVRDPEPWDVVIAHDGAGWDDLINRVLMLRYDDDAPDDLYYYGMLNPEETLDEYCPPTGCIAGVTLLNGSNDVRLRTSMGIGYAGYAENTGAHELSHAHGALHAPCGPAAPSSVDSKYPYAGGKTGVWGLDTASMTLYDPETTTDFMGYCDVEWISDYTYKRLLARASKVNLPQTVGDARVPSVIVSVNGKGEAKWGGATKISPLAQGKPVQARVSRGGAAVESVEASWFTIDHLDGGVAIVPVSSAGVQRIELVVDGRRFTVTP